MRVGTEEMAGRYRLDVGGSDNMYILEKLLTEDEIRYCTNEGKFTREKERGVRETIKVKWEGIRDERNSE